MNHWECLAAMQQANQMHDNNSSKNSTPLHDIIWFTFVSPIWVHWAHFLPPFQTKERALLRPRKIFDPRLKYDLFLLCGCDIWLLILSCRGRHFNYLVSHFSILSEFLTWHKRRLLSTRVSHRFSKKSARWRLDFIAKILFGLRKKKTQKRANIALSFQRISEGSRVVRIWGWNCSRVRLLDSFKVLVF